jgi:hypothetical protein
MCISSPKTPSPPPAPEPLPPTPPAVTQGVTGKKQMSPQVAGESSEAGQTASNKSRIRLGRGSLRIPLTSEGSGLNYPTS